MEPAPIHFWSPLPGVTSGLDPLSAAVALVSHHDAVTGTARQHVTNDYAKYLSLGRQRANAVLDLALKALFGLKGEDVSSSFVRCNLLNESLCEPTQGLVEKTGKEVLMVAYNPLGYTRTERVRLPIT